MIARFICAIYGHGKATLIATWSEGRKKTQTFYCHRCNRHFKREYWTA